MSSATDIYVRRYSAALAEEGGKLIRKAFDTANFRKDKTQNLHDSYGSCVFYRGREMPNTRRYVGRKALVGKVDPQGDLVFGRAEIDGYFDGYRPSSKGFELVFAVAMFYAVELEEGIGLRRKYRVLSGVGSDIEELARQLHGRVVNIDS